MSCPACVRPGQLHLGHLVGALSNWVRLQAEYDCFYFVADWHALTSDYADTSRAHLVRVRERGRLDRRRPRSRAKHVVRPVAGAGARRAVPAAVDGRAGALARTRADLQGAAGQSLKDKDLSSIGFLGYPLLQTADVAIYDAQFVPVGRRSGRAPRARARSGAALQQRTSAMRWSNRSRS